MHLINCMSEWNICLTVFFKKDSHVSFLLWSFPTTHEFCAYMNSIPLFKIRQYHLSGATVHLLSSIHWVAVGPDADSIMSPGLGPHCLMEVMVV
jgi:hypothetical protein